MWPVHALSSMLRRCPRDVHALDYVRSNMKRSSSFLVVFGFVLFAYGVFAAESVTNLVPRVAITNLLANKKAYQGKRVEVAGYYKSAFELSAIYHTQADAQAG